VARHDLSIDRVTRSRHNLFASVPLDRLAEYRDDEEWLHRAVAADSARFIPLWRNRNLLRGSGDGQKPVFLKASDLGPGSEIEAATLLGSDGECCFFAVAVDDGVRDRLQRRIPGAEFIDLRLASVDIDARHAGILAYAKALLYWHYRNAFCGTCGQPNQRVSAGHRLRCSSRECGRESFPRIDPAIIVLVTQGDACLLGRNAAWPPKRFSTLAGFVEPGESLEDAVVREVREEAGVRLAAIDYASSQPWPFPSSAMCGFRAEARDRASAASDEMEELRWLTAAGLDDAIEQDELRLPPPVSIAFQLVAEWYREQCGGDLARRVRASGSWLQRKGIK
jgi:NAD+ diphosphatase